MKLYKKQITVIIILFLFTGYFSCENPSHTKPRSSQEIKQNIKDSFNYLPTSTTGEIVYHKYYSLSYHEEYENPEWVAYSLSPEQISKAQRKRPYFIRDPKVSTRSAHYKNYYPNGYEKGHLLPAADRRFNEEAFDETFYTSNVAPMDHYFNSGIWNDLEKQVRYWAKRYGKLYIVTGGVLKPGLERIGRENVAVPDEFYKIILDNNNPDKPKMIGFLIKHHDSLVSPKVFVVSVDSIEKITGIDFFPSLPDSIENNIEKEVHPEKWKFVHFKRY
jgi:endonuclease G